MTRGRQGLGEDWSGKGLEEDWSGNGLADTLGAGLEKGPGAGQENGPGAKQEWGLGAKQERGLGAFVLSKTIHSYFPQHTAPNNSLQPLKLCTHSEHLFIYDPKSELARTQTRINTRKSELHLT